MSDDPYKAEVEAICGEKNDKVTVFMVRTLLKIEREGCARFTECQPPIPTQSQKRRMNPALVGSAAAAALVGFIETLKALLGTVKTP